ncbi:restriction endonuclease subunit S [Cohnella candidum]|uniref:Restriction endonuclease subunit S n=1 Tax=Cohnella candidum TaxID=2674991 RepID=A0A3G3JT83_9BACL|nr:restriction endonuclease subunit S [Cohnella candidum]AYQ71435.1 restriction endonuclease subunit S [Cohnella candidum]
MGRKEQDPGVIIERAFATTLQSLADIQRNISLVLGAKAAESEKVRGWLQYHLKEPIFETNTDRLSVCMLIHEQQIEVIEGLAKLCNGLSRNMKLILHPDQVDGQDAGGSSENEAEDSGR